MTAANEARCLNYRLLLHRMVTLNEEAAHRIANDIHDDTLQSIIVAQMRLQKLGSKAAGTPIAEELERIASAVDEAVHRLRKLVFELRPDDLNHGVAGVLRRQLDDIVSVSGITAGTTVEFRVPHRPRTTGMTISEPS